MKTTEMNCGTKSFSKVAKLRGYDTWTTDINPIFNPDFVGDMLEEKTQEVILDHVRESDLVWMSPTCTYWSLSAGNTYWTKFRMPRNDKAIQGIKMMMFCRFIADYCIKTGKIFFIENPNGRAVWILDNQYLKRAWYCQYGDTRAKPTNIWTNLKIDFKTCFNGNTSCHHEAAPRGSKTGTQGLKGSIDRSVIPDQLFQHIFDVYDGGQLQLTSLPLCEVKD